MNVLWAYIVAAATVGAAAAGIAFTDYHYWGVHTPAFELVQAEMLYDKCVRECKEICQITGNSCEEGSCEAFCKAKYLQGD
jgi:hypothetical protein